MMQADSQTVPYLAASFLVADYTQQATGIYIYDHPALPDIDHALRAPTPQIALDSEYLRVH
jgi:hypothetical protein